MLVIIRVQQRLHLAGAPSVGNWDVYSQAWFESATGSTAGAWLSLMHRFFMGHPPSGLVSWHRPQSVFDVGAGSAEMKRWEWTGGESVPIGSQSFTPQSISTTSEQTQPSQVALAIGYRRPHHEGEFLQRGRSRHWIGPLDIGMSQPGGGLAYRIPSALVDDIVENVVGCLDGLAGLGWVLQVKSGELEAATFEAVDEIYVDDVLDVMRSRRADVRYQKRTAI